MVNASTLTLRMTHCVFNLYPILVSVDEFPSHKNIGPKLPFELDQTPVDSKQLP